MPGAQFLLQGVKRVFDTKALYAQLVITENCNLSCGYCNEYLPGAPPVPSPRSRSGAISSRLWVCSSMICWAASRCYTRTWPR